MEKNSKAKYIIITLVALIVIFGAIWAVYTYVIPNKNEPATVETTVEGESTFISNSTLDTLLDEQPMFVESVKYFEKSSLDWLENDAMGASVFNNSDINIQTFTVAFCAFDESGNPIKIKQPGEEGDGGYVRTVKYDMTAIKGEEAYIAPSGSFEDIYFYVSSEPKVATIKACVKTYASTDNISWSNPYYETFKNNYSGKALSFADSEAQ